MTEPKKTRRRHHAKVALIEFLRPGAERSSALSLEIAFQTMRYLIASGVGFKTHHRWNTTSITGLLGGLSQDHSHPEPVTSIEDLIGRFHKAIFATGSGEIEAWRQAKGIHAYAELELDFLHYRPFAPVEHLGFLSERAIKNALSDLFEKAPGRRTAVSLNYVHYKAVAVHKVDVTLYPEGFSFKLRFGFHTPEEMRTQGDSEWEFCLASTENNEPFLDTLHRALEKYAFIMDPANAHLTTSRDDDGFVPKRQKANRDCVAVEHLAHH